MQRKRFWLGNYQQICQSPTTVKTSIIDIDCHNIVKPSRRVLNLCVTVIVNILFQIIFIFPLFLGMVMYAYEFKTKKKTTINWNKKLPATYLLYYYYLFFCSMFKVETSFRICTCINTTTSWSQSCATYKSLYGHCDMAGSRWCWCGNHDLGSTDQNSAYKSTACLIYLNKQDKKHCSFLIDTCIYLFNIMQEKTVIYSGVRRWE